MLAAPQCNIIFKSWLLFPLPNPWLQRVLCSAFAVDLTQVMKDLSRHPSLSPLCREVVSHFFFPLAFAFCHCNTTKSCSVTHRLQCLVFSTMGIRRLNLHGKMAMGTVRLTENICSFMKSVGDFSRHHSLC